MGIDAGLFCTFARMAKKLIISDFSALKGKVSFSEKSYEAKMSPKVTPTSAPDKPKVLEDGLIIDAAYGEFAVTREHEISALKETKVKQKKTTSVPDGYI